MKRFFSGAPDISSLFKDIVRWRSTNNNNNNTNNNNNVYFHFDIQITKIGSVEAIGGLYDRTRQRRRFNTWKEVTYEERKNYWQCSESVKCNTLQTSKTEHQ